MHHIYIYTTVSGKIHCTIAQLLKTRPKQNKPGLQRDLPVQAVPGSNHLKTAADTHQEHQHTLLVVSILITSWYTEISFTTHAVSNSNLICPFFYACACGTTSSRSSQNPSASSKTMCTPFGNSTCCSHRDTPLVCVWAQTHWSAADVLPHEILQHARCHAR